MPESEPKPKLIELVAPGAGQGWKAVLRSGKPAVVHEIPVPPAEAQAAVPRLQRLYEHRHPALSPVLAWGTDQAGVWVAVEPNEGTPLGTILSRGPLTPPAAAALGAAVLSGVAALHEAGIAMGGFGATAVRVTNNGEVRLAGHPAAAVRGAPSQSDLRADVRSGGMAVCAAFGVDPAGAPAPQNIPPGLVVTMRSMASGAMGPSADRAQGALREMAAALLAPDRQTASQVELATRAGGREMPKITPFIPAAQPATREETPVRRSASYDAPDRQVQTYPAMPAVTFPPEIAPAAAAPAPPVAPVEPKTSEPAVPTWSEAPPRTEPPYEAPAPAMATNPPVPAPAMATNPPAPAPPAPAPEPPAAAPAPPAPAAPTPPAPPTWEPAASEPSKPVSPFESVAPPTPAATASAFGTNPPAPAPAFATNPPAPAAPPAPAPPEPPKQPQTWSPVEAPVWQPGEAVPAETLGTGVAMTEAEAPAPPPPVETPEPAPVRPPTAPVRRPTVPRPPSRGGIPTERPPWLIPAAVAVVIVILLGVFGIVVLSHRGGSSGNPVARTSPTPRTSSTPKSSPSASPTGQGQPKAVPNYGPASADPVSKVQFCTTDTPCPVFGSPAETGTACSLTSCTVEVSIYFSPQPKGTAYSYTIKLFDRCSGTTTDLPGSGGSTLGDRWISGIGNDHVRVDIPAGAKSVALVAVAQKPAVAASAPLLLGASSCA